MEKLALSDVKNLAVLLIDMQEEFLDTRKRLLIPNQIDVLKFCKTNDIPLAVIEYCGCGETDTLLQQEIKKISASNVCKFTKHCNNSFSLKSLNDWLKSMEIKTLLLMGVHSCSCVLETAESAIELGYTIITSGDLIASCGSSSCNNQHEWYMKNGTCVDNHSMLIDGSL